MEDLIALIGEENTKKLAQAFGGQRIYIPTRADISERNSKMRVEFESLLAGGSTCMNAYQDLSKEHGLSVRQVQNVVNAR
jgi:Mor family transcriptional regulator